MSNTITVTSGTGVLVVSDSILRLVHTLAGAAHELQLQYGVLSGLIDSWLLEQRAASALATTAGAHSRPVVPESAMSAHHCMGGALELLGLARSRAENLHSVLQTSLITYEAVDGAVTTVWRGLQEQAAWGLGTIARVFAVPVVLSGAAAVLVTQAVTGVTPAQQAERALAYVNANPRLITNQRFVGLVRSVVSNLDGFGVGFAGLPPSVETVFGGGGLGFLGAPSSAREVVAAARTMGLFRETPVSVSKFESFDGGAAPSGLSGRFARIPNTTRDEGDAQIRIDRYSTPGQPDRFDVYLAGTVTFDPKATTEPFDLTSDVVGVAQESPGSVRAAAEAMRQAGITAKSPVVLNGYSEGGLIAALLASSGRYNVKGLVTFGGPIGQIPIAADIPVLTVRNTDDLVPATGGYDVNPHAVVVERSAYEGRDMPNDLPVPAHERPAYRETAALADASTNESLRSVLASLDRLGGTSAAHTTLWRAVRETPGTGSGVSCVAPSAAGG